MSKYKKGFVTLFVLVIGLISILFFVSYDSIKLDSVTYESNIAGEHKITTIKYDKDRRIKKVKIDSTINLVDWYKSTHDLVIKLAKNKKERYSDKKGIKSTFKINDDEIREKTTLTVKELPQQFFQSFFRSDDENNNILLDDYTESLRQEGAVKK